jgi:hypothetical protein
MSTDYFSNVKIFLDIFFPKYIVIKKILYIYKHLYRSNRINLLCRRHIMMQHRSLSLSLSLSLSFWRWVYCLLQTEKFAVGIFVYFTLKWERGIQIRMFHTPWYSYTRFNTVNDRKMHMATKKNVTKRSFHCVSLQNPSGAAPRCGWHRRCFVSAWGKCITMRAGGCSFVLVGTDWPSV